MERYYMVFFWKDNIEKCENDDKINCLIYVFWLMLWCKNKIDKKNRDFFFFLCYIKVKVVIVGL